MNITLTTLNARYSHTSLALRYLYANLKELKESTSILEFSINENIQEIVDKLFKTKPSIIGIGVYIWNSTEVSKIIKIIKDVSPSTTIVLGGPEVSYEPYRVDFSCADYIIKGEGEVSFYKLCKDVISGNIREKIIKPHIPTIEDISLPYKYYTDFDLKNRVLYVEASRGCPFSCEFCLSSIDPMVRDFNIDNLLVEFQSLWERGARSFKFIDRTFNLNPEKCEKILDFFLCKDELYMVHFEVIPENFPERIKEKLKQFPKGTLQLEVGIQTLNPEVAEKISRKMNFNKIKKNLEFLQNETNAHLHVDLIIGLPGEELESFANNLETLTNLTNCEIQLGVLKKLSGTTIDRHDLDFRVVYNGEPPYDILQNKFMDFAKVQEMKRFARFWDLTYNSGNFKTSLKTLWAGTTVFNGFLEFTRWLYNRSETTYQISLNRLTEYMFEYFVDILGVERIDAANMLVEDLMRVGGRKVPMAIRSVATAQVKKRTETKSLGKRQGRH